MRFHRNTGALCRDCCQVSRLLSLQSRRALAGVVLFVFRLGVLVVCLEGIAVCGYCGVHALHRSVCFLGKA